MLIALCLILAVAVVVLAVLNVKVRARLGEYVATDAQRSHELDTVRTDMRDAVALADEAGRERDEALERVQRSRRDSAEVANRLSETAARAEELAEENRSLTAANRDLTSRAAAAPPLDGDVLWGLTLSRLDRRWRVSVAAGVDSTSPLLTSDSLLADAVAIETEAAREEAGVPIDLTYVGDGDVDGAAAATTVALVEELVAGVVHVADWADLGVTVTEDAVLVSLTATSDGKSVDVPGPADLLDADGRYRIERVAEAAATAD